MGNEPSRFAVEAGEKIDVSGVSKGPAAAPWRWNQHRGPWPTAPSILPRRGLRQAPTRPLPRVQNKHMPSHYGVERVTVRTPEIVRVDAERNLLLIKGAVPG